MPFNSAWNAVVVGRWNRAILTPAGIGTIIFNVAEATAMEVAVSIDAHLPHRVHHDGVWVVAASDRLIIEPDVHSYAELQKSKLYAARAVGDLSRTPMIAAGINIRREIERPSDQLSELAADSDDGKLGELGLNIVQRSLKRGVEWEGGVINISVDREQGGNYLVGLNFDRQSKNPAELKAFLETPIDQLQQISESIARTYLGIEGFE